MEEVKKEPEAQPTTRELQLEMQVMIEHKNALIAKGQALQAQATAIQAQGALLQIESERTDAEIARLKVLLAPRPELVPKPAEQTASEQATA